MTEELSLSWVDPWSITQQDIEWLAASEQHAPAFQRFQLEEILTALSKGEMSLFRYEPGPGIVLTQTQVSNDIKRLVILKTAGSNVIWSFAKVAELLKRTARQWGCEGIMTHVYGSQESLAKALIRLGAKPESITMFLEIDDG